MALATAAILANLCPSLALGGQAATIADLVPIRVLQALMTSQTLADLNRVRESVLAPDVTIEVAYGMRLCDLGANKAGESVLLESLPRNEIEFVVLFSVPVACKRAGITLSDRLCTMPDAYLGMVGKILPKHPRYFRRFLMLSLFADGYISEDLNSINQQLAKVNRPAFVSALRTLAPQVRQRVCGDCVGELRP